MKSAPTSLNVYDNEFVAGRYHQKKGFAPERKEKLLGVTQDLLIALAPAQSTLLELGAGSGLLTQKLVEKNHFRKIFVTDGAPAMLEIAQKSLPDPDGRLQFDLLDFSTEWSHRFEGKKFTAVTSSMAIHHAPDKGHLFRQVLTILKPGGVFVFGDHMAGSTPLNDYLIGRERALIRLGKESPDEVEIAAAIQLDHEKQTREGNLCESVVQYITSLETAGFIDVDCLWRDYWLAVFVARKPDNSLVNP